MTKENFMVERKAMLMELVELLRKQGLDYGQALIVLKDAQLHLERASLKNRI